MTLTLSTVPTPQYYYYVNKYCGTNTTSFSYDPACTRIKVKIGAYTSTGIYSLPTAIGTSTIIALGADGEGVGPYTITIYKSANNQFKLSVGNTAY
ncbi:hypothetical protein F0919_12055 [Taibaiella lutea]|uniref:Uncharacterized protein n=1 Tax=Taibaiella lutea TaxID=2608001 RepID=A0A5M6CDM1_9BACT|nr:hypothetical protein [Taibaiella lutea]KAA5533274.1 hypothetical protein F0919_12055 [Taibaiella lutea]